MNTKTLAELEQDENFFNDLREGNFVLVLGAGFSYGIRNCVEQKDIDEINNAIEKESKNKQESEKNILLLTECCKLPLGKDFVNITNKIFNLKLDIRDYTLAANTWIKNVFTINELNIEPFFRKLFTPSNVYIEENIDLLESIFYPKWQSIYTLNFDTTLQQTLSISKKNNRKYETIAFPEKKGVMPGLGTPTISHLHNIITTKKIEDLIFGEKSYKVIKDSKQTIYDSLSTEISQGKKMLIIGTQLHEEIITDNFWNSIGTNKTIFHLDTDNSTLSSKDAIENQNYTFVKLENDVTKEIEGTKLFLKFLKKYEDQIENIQFDGAITINQTFIDNEKKKTPKAEQFYAGIQDYQWNGVLNDFDFIRKEYAELEKNIINSFNSNKKIASFIEGRGGAGKSTLLRRLALHCAINTNYKILWLKEDETTNFDTNKFKEYNDYQFLVFIEDWYRVRDKRKEEANNFLTSILEKNNVRIIVGDRSPISSTFKNEILEKDIIEIDNNQNKDILEHVKNKLPDWEPTIENILGKPTNLQITTFLLLWLIGRLATNKELNKETKGITDVDDLVRKITTSDLKKIATQYSGLAKAMYYFACIYKKQKITISKDGFNALVNEYSNGEDEYWYDDTEIMKLFNIYYTFSTLSTKTFGNLNIIKLQHDILADDALSQIDVSDESLKWKKFDTPIIKRIRDLAVNKLDEFSCEKIINYIFQNENKIWENNVEEQLECIDILINKNIWGNFLSNLFNGKININKIKQLEYFDKITRQSNQIINKLSNTIYIILNELSYEKMIQAFIAKILLTKKFWENISPDIVICAIRRVSINIAKDAANQILLQEGFWDNINAEIVANALNKAANNIAKDGSNKILMQEGFWKNINNHIVSTALNKASHNIAIDAANKILIQEKIWEDIDESIVSTAFNKASHNIATDAANKILVEENFWENINKSLVSAAFNKASHNIATGAANKILVQENFWESINNSIVSTALNKAIHNIAIDAANKILIQEKFWENIDESIVSTTFNKASHNIATDAANKILEQENFWESINKSIVSTALNKASHNIATDAANKILIQEKFGGNINEEIVSTAFNKASRNIATDAANKILAQENFWESNNKSIVSTAFNKASDNIASDAANKILVQENFWENINEEIVSTALNKATNNIATDAANKILVQENFWENINKSIVSTTFNKASHNIATDAANKILIQENFWENINEEIVSNVLNKADPEIALLKANEILEQSNFVKFASQIIALALKKASPQLSKRKSIEILYNSKTEGNKKDIICNSLIILRKEKEGIEFAILFLQGHNWKEDYKWNIAFQSLNCLALLPNTPQIAIDIANTIFKEYNQYPTAQGNYHRFINILKIPFHNIPKWKYESQKVLRNFSKYKTANSITNVLQAYKTYPIETLEACSIIMANWDKEITIPIPQTYRHAEDHYGDHIKIALGHPYLKTEAIDCAKRIIKAYKANKIKMPVDYLIEIAEDIVENNKFPEWELNNNLDE